MGFPCVLYDYYGVGGSCILRILYLGHVGSSGGCRVTSSLGTWWESGLGLMGVLGVCWGWGFPMDIDSGAVGCWDTWTGPWGLT